MSSVGSKFVDQSNHHQEIYTIQNNEGWQLQAKYSQDKVQFTVSRHGIFYNKPLNIYASNFVQSSSKDAFLKRAIQHLSANGNKFGFQVQPTQESNNLIIGQYGLPGAGKETGFIGGTAAMIAGGALLVAGGPATIAVAAAAAGVSALVHTAKKSDEEFSATECAKEAGIAAATSIVSGGIASVTFGPILSGLRALPVLSEAVKQVAARALTGAFAGTVANTTQSLVSKGELPSGQSIASSAAAGFVGSAVGQGMTSVVGDIADDAANAVLLKGATGAVAGGATSAAATITSNVVKGEEWDKDLAESTMMGVTIGAATATAQAVHDQKSNAASKKTDAAEKTWQDQHKKEGQTLTDRDAKLKTQEQAYNDQLAEDRKWAQDVTNAGGKSKANWERGDGQSESMAQRLMRGEKVKAKINTDNGQIEVSRQHPKIVNPGADRAQWNKDNAAHVQQGQQHQGSVPVRTANSLNPLYAPPRDNQEEEGEEEDIVPPAQPVQLAQPVQNFILVQPAHPVQPIQPVNPQAQAAVIPAAPAAFVGEDVIAPQPQIPDQPIQLAQPVQPPQPFQPINHQVQAVPVISAAPAACNVPPQQPALPDPVPAYNPRMELEEKIRKGERHVEYLQKHYASCKRERRSILSLQIMEHEKRLEQLKRQLANMR